MAKQSKEEYDRENREQHSGDLQAEKGREKKTALHPADSGGSGEIDREKLLALAREARKNAYTPYSNFPIGAALLTEDGAVFTGCNIENSVYGLTNCAERTAIQKAVSEGYHSFKALAVIADSQHPVTPCGACRQVISEFNTDRDIKIILANLKGEILETTGRELLPRAFGKKDMD